MKWLTWLCIVVLGVSLLSGLWSLTGGPLWTVVSTCWDLTAQVADAGARR